MRPAENTVPELVPIEKLEQDILNLCVGINAATYELLFLIRQFEERGGFLKWGSEDCAAWLAWRCDFSLATAREKVRVARALKDLPLVSEHFASGALSYSKVRELTRVANRSNEQDLVEFSLKHTTSFVAGRCREMRMGSASSVGVAATAFANRGLRIRRDDDRGMMVVNVELPLEVGELLEKALDKARNDECLELSDLVDTSWSKRQADAFVAMLTEYLQGDAEDGTSRSDNYLVNVHVDHSALKGDPGRSSLPIETVKRLCCDGAAVTVVEDGQGQPMNVGRKSRVVPTNIQRAVRARDNNCCVFPGCRNSRFLHCHHIEHWSNGGETSLDNLVLLCTKHHTLVHEGGFRIERDFKDGWYFVRPDGVGVPETGYGAQDMIEADLEESYLDPPRGGLLSTLEKLVNEPPPPSYRH
jgi:hypothetical protein